MVVVLSGKAKQEIAYSTRLTNAFGGRDYAAAGLCDFLLRALLDWLLGTEVSAFLLSGPAQARGGLPTARSQLAKCRQLSHGHGLPRSCACATEWYLFWLWFSMEEEQRLVILLLYN
ncbi:hypothetical protein SporoS204_13275 [Sporosarcina ureae]|uniref:Uncharacterized protein n=1 Tax=Sporosarcina ureae TaxID=1571 RepID=A0ABM6JXW4_SPOUR|nr:hypothetical protein SporoS204_13275 [Sporosarcina ureae]